LRGMQLVRQTAWRACRNRRRLEGDTGVSIEDETIRPHRVHLRRVLVSPVCSTGP
jgi:hypothetical protein